MVAAAVRAAWRLWLAPFVVVAADMAAAVPELVHSYRKLSSLKTQETAVEFVSRRSGSSCATAPFPALVGVVWVYWAGEPRISSASVHDELTGRIALYTTVAGWLDGGAPAGMGRVLRAVRAAILERVLPATGAGPRTYGWWYCCTLLSFVELVCLCRMPLRQNRCRLALRCLPPGLQACLVSGDLRSPFWRAHWRGALAGLHPCAERAGGVLGVVYVLADARSGLL